MLLRTPMVVARPEDDPVKGASHDNTGVDLKKGDANEDVRDKLADAPQAPGHRSAWQRVRTSGKKQKRNPLCFGASNYHALMHQ